MPLSRRELFRVCGGAAAVLALPACGDNDLSRVFANDELHALETFADVIIPPDDEPGGLALGAVPFIERLLRAFVRVEVRAGRPKPSPPIYGSGPFSDRNPYPDANGLPSDEVPVNDFEAYVELDRVADRAWRLRVLGSSAVEGGAPNEDLLGPVLGLHDELRAGLAAAAANKPPTTETLAQQTEWFDAQPDEFKQLLIELVTEAAFAAPEYGGNIGLAGWALCHFEGDSIPLGYSQYTPAGYVERAGSPVSTANPGPDPAPMSAEVLELIGIVVNVLGGRVTP